MAGKLVHVEIDGTGLPCRIFRNKDWRKLPDDHVLTMTKADAVGVIRQRVFRRSQKSLGQAECEKCGRYITEDSFEMNEIRPKGAGGGKTGGEVSLSNCEALCHSCHQGSPDSAHGNRRWQSAKITSDEGPNGN